MTLTQTEIIQRATHIRLVVLDVDGILTDGKLYLNQTGEELKVFHVLDGLGVELLIRAGIDVGIISGRSCEVVRQRANALGIKEVHLGQKNKLICFQQLIEKLNLTLDQVAAMGDDLPDLCILNRVALSATVKNAHPLIQSRCHWIAQRMGGRGAVREFADFILTSQGKLERLIESYQ